jgi:hypothetical protein
VLYNYSRNLTTLALLASSKSDPQKRQAILAAALGANPQIPMVWEAVERALKEDGSPEELMQHYQKMAEQFATQDDVKITALERLWRLQQKANLVEAADETQARMLKCRSDLAIRAGAMIIEDKLTAGKFDEVKKLYDLLLPKLSTKNGNGGGGLYYGFVCPIVVALQNAKQHSLAVQSLDAAEPLFSLDGIGPLANDLEELRNYLNQNP